MSSVNMDANSVPKNNFLGSYNDDDPDRPRWGAQTEPLEDFHYKHADGTYSSTRRKGKNPNGEKTYMTARQNLIPFGERIDPEDKKPWLTGQGDEPLLLYRLPELVAASKQPLPEALVLEGEKDVETARGLGFTATCNPNGALKWRDEFSEHLRGFHVVILPDNDQRGREHGELVAQSVHGIAQTVKVVNLPAVPDKGDLTDWVEARRNDGETDAEIADALRQLIDHAPVADTAPKKREAKIANVVNLTDEMAARDEWAGVVAYDEFRDQIMLLRPVPGTPVPKANFVPRQWRDADDISALKWFQRNGNRSRGNGASGRMLS